MAEEKDQIDHDALAAEWGVALEAEQTPAGAAEGRLFSRLFAFFSIRSFHAVRSAPVKSARILRPVSWAPQPQRISSEASGARPD